MHKISIPDALTERVIARRGSAHPFSDLVPEKTALIVVDLQNGFMMPGVAHALCETAVEIVPNVNRLAAALRAAGGKVFWIQNTHDENCLTEWSALNGYTAPDRLQKRTESMSIGTKGHQLWAGLDVQPEDEKVLKYRFSAFIQGSSDLPERLKQQGYEWLLITGTVTNVCCESSARDAMMLNFRPIMITDGNAAQTDEEHNASLCSVYNAFGDIMSTDEVIALLEAGATIRLAG